MKETRLTRALTWLIDIIFSGLLWCLFSLPLVTVGAALYYTAVKNIRHGRRGQGLIPAQMREWQNPSVSGEPEGFFTPPAGRRRSSRALSRPFP